MWNKPKYPSTKERKNMHNLHMPTKIKIASFAEKCMDLKGITLTNETQAQGNK